MRLLLIILFFISADYYLFSYRLDNFLEHKEVNFNRVKEDVREIGSSPRVSGSINFYNSKQYIISSIEGIDGIKIQVNDDDEFHKIKKISFYGDTNSIIASINSNKNHAPSLIITSHYDTAVGTRGVNDNAAAVGVLIEFLRVVSNSQNRNMNIVAVFTSNEEWGLLGAKSFFNKLDHYTKDGVKYFINLEARGDFGVSSMFQFNQEANGFHDFISSSNLLNIDSILDFLYSTVPNITEVDVIPKQTKDSAFILNFAYFGNGYAYHNSYDKKLNELGAKHHLANLLLSYQYLNKNHHLNKKNNANFIYIQIGKNLNFSLQRWQLYSVFIIIVCIGLYAIRRLLKLSKAKILTSQWVKTILVFLAPLLFSVILIKIISTISYEYALSVRSILVYIITLIPTIYLTKRLVSKFNIENNYLILFWCISFLLSITMVVISLKLLWLSVLLMASGSYLVFSYKRSLKFLRIIPFILIAMSYQLIEFLFLLGGINTPLLTFVLVYFLAYPMTLFTKVKTHA